jgi:Rho family protein
VFYPLNLFKSSHVTCFPPQWIEEVREICGPTVPILLVGCKADLRPTSPDADPSTYVSRSQAERVAAAIGARGYKECSALKIEGVDDVFEAATRLSMLMREGVPTHSSGDGKYHRRKSNGMGSSSGQGGGKCCVIC